MARRRWTGARRCRRGRCRRAPDGLGGCRGCALARRRWAGGDSLLVQSPSGVKRPMLPVTATVHGPGLMIAARVRELRSRSLRPGWPEHPLARLLICLFPGMSPGSRSLRLGWQGCPLAQTLSCPNPGMPPNSRSLRPGWPGCPLARILTLNPVMWKLPERRPEAGPLSAGRVPWP